jgi:acyl carrier protein
MATNIDKLLSIIQRELAIDPRDLKLDSRLADLADSLDWVNLLAAMEETFGLQIGTEEGLRLQTLSDLMLLVAEPRLVTA